MLKAMLQIGLKKSLSLKKLKIQFHGHMLLMIVMVKKLFEHSMKTTCKEQKRKNFKKKSNQEKGG